MDCVRREWRDVEEGEGRVQSEMREFTQSGKVVEVVPKQRRARRAPVGPAPMEMEMPIAPDGVPAFMNPQFCNFIDLAAEWMGGLSGAAQYVRFIAEWRVTGGK